MNYDELVKRLQTGHDSQCAMSYGMHEHCCDCSYVDRQNAADAIVALQARVAELEAERDHFKGCISAREVRAMVDERNKAWSNRADARILLKQANEMLAEAIMCGPKLRKRIDAFLNGEKND